MLAALQQLSMHRMHPQTVITAWLLHAAGDGVLLGAGVSVLGPITVGAGSKVGAGSVVVQNLPDHCVAVGVPARVIKSKIKREPSIDMDQCTEFLLDYQI